MAGQVCIGLDGCRAGWMAATHGDVFVREKLAELLAAVDTAPGRPVVAIDMPIGLAPTGRRECDILARRYLGPARRASVF